MSTVVARPDGAPPERAGGRGRTVARGVGLVVAVAVLGLAALVSLAVGTATIPVAETVRAFTDFAGTDEHLIVRALRLPRTLAGIVVGAALGCAGALMQGLTRNPLADPGILGVEAGAAFAVVSAILLLGVSSATGQGGFAVVGALGAAVVVYTLGAAGRAGQSPVALALAGAALAAFLSALTSAILVLDAQTLDQFRFWVVGSLAGRDLDIVLGAGSIALVGLLLCLLCGRALNAFALGEEVAGSLGVRVAAWRPLIGIAAVLCAGGAVAVAGPIGFVGLTVPHIARALVGVDYRWIVLYTMVLGGILLLVADVVGRVVVRPAELQVGIVTAAIGAPVFIALVRRVRMARL